MGGILKSLIGSLVPMSQSIAVPSLPPKGVMSRNILGNVWAVGKGDGGIIPSFLGGNQSVLVLLIEDYGIFLLAVDILG